MVLPYSSSSLGNPVSDKKNTFCSVFPFKHSLLFFGVEGGLICEYTKKIIVSVFVGLQSIKKNRWSDRLRIQNYIFINATYF